MKIDLINPPRTHFDHSEIAPPLGLLRLADAARSSGADISITDFNLLYHIKDDFAVSDDFYLNALDILLNKDANAYCFTSMAVDSHVAIKLAEMIKEERPEVLTVFGGTHFGSIATELLENYPWIDCVVMREGESFIKLLASGISNVKRRSIFQGTPENNPNITQLPLDLVSVDEYFSVNTNRTLDFESGRGCRYKCAFCYSPTHYDSFRDFSVDSTIRALAQAHDVGFERIFFVQDNFINDPLQATELCKEILSAGLKMNWQAYVTFPQLSSEIISVMAQAGCTEIFAGIDAVGKESRRMHKKSFVRDIELLESRIRDCVQAGITPTCAFLVSPPSHRGGVDIEKTLRFALAARCAGANVRINTLSYYNGTTSYSDNPSLLEFDEFEAELMLDVPEFVVRNEYAKKHPDLYPFHSRYVDANEWREFHSIVHCLFTLLASYPKSISHAWKNGQISPIQIAKLVLDNIGPLLAIRKLARRDAEVLEAINIMQAVMSNKRGFYSVLEQESACLVKV